MPYADKENRIRYHCQLDGLWTFWLDGRVCMRGVSWSEFLDEILALRDLFGLEAS